MYSGELHQVRFEYSGPSIEAVLDRLLTADILEENDRVYVLSVEGIRKVINIWLRSQGEYVKLLQV